MSTRIFALIGRIIRTFYVRMRIPGLERALRHGASICVANHLGSFGPLAVMSNVFGRLHPWVIAEVTDIERCGAYIRKDFVEKELRLRSFLARELSGIIGRVCVRLMRCLRAIPVHRQGSEVLRTLEMSVACLRQGRPLLVFPEDDQSKQRGRLCGLNTGFIRVARRLYERTRQIAVFYPIAIRKWPRGARVGAPVTFDPKAPFGEERVRIKRELERSIRRMYRSIELEHHGRRRLSPRARRAAA